MLRIAMICHENLYHTFVGVMYNIHSDIELSPPLTSWNAVLSWLNNNKTDGIVLDEGISFAERVKTFGWPCTVFRGDMDQFMIQYRTMVEKLLLTISPPRLEKTENERKIIKIPILGITAETEETEQPQNHHDVEIEDEIEDQEKMDAQNQEEQENKKVNVFDKWLNKTSAGKKTSAEMPLNQRLGQAKKGLHMASPLSLSRKLKQRTDLKEKQTIRSFSPERIVFYSPKGNTGVTKAVLYLSQITQSGVVEISYPYGQLAGILGVNPEYTLYNIQAGYEHQAICNGRFMLSPWVYPIHETWNADIVREWLQKGARAFADKMIMVDLYSFASLPILHAVTEWSDKMVWILQDQEEDLGLADIQISNLRKKGADTRGWYIVIQTLTGQDYPWSDVLELPLLSSLPSMNMQEKWQEAWLQTLIKLTATEKSLRWLARKEG